MASPCRWFAASPRGATACPVLRTTAGGGSTTMSPRRRPPGGHFDAVMVCEARYPVGEAASVFLGDRRLDLPVGVARHAAPRGADRRQRLSRRDARQAAVLRRRRLRQGLAVRHPLRGGGTQAPPISSCMSATTIIAAPSGASCFPTSLTGYAAPLKVSVYDTGDLDDEDEPSLPIGAAYWSQNIEGSPNPDKWTNWRDDFFRPAARLLVAAPWLFSRGNHELCSRGGPGWFYLLDVNSPLLGPGRRQRRSVPPQLPADWRPGAWPKPPRVAFRRPAIPDRVRRAVPAQARQAQHHRRRFGQCRRRRALQSRDLPHAVWRGSEDAGRGSDADLAGDAPARLGRGQARQGRPDRAHALRLHQRDATRKRSIACSAEACRATSRPSSPDTCIGSRRSVSTGRTPPHLAVGTGGMELSHVQPPPSPENPKAPVRVDGLDRGPAYVVGLRDFAAMIVQPVEDGTWSSVLYGIEGQALAICDSRWPGPGRQRSICELK